jgi:hypothetical protein
MSELVLSLNGARANTARLVVPFAGRWVVDVELDGAAVPVGPARVTIGGLTLVGTVVPARSGAFVGVARVRVVSGAGGWSRVAPSRSYHDDAGVRRALALEQIARDVGETIETTGDATRLGIDLVLHSETAARVLDHVLDGTHWRVDYDGVTRYGARPAATLGPGVELLDVDMRARRLTLAAPDPSAVPIGALVTDARMSVPLVVREFEAVITPGTARILAWGVLA